MAHKVMAYVHSLKDKKTDTNHSAEVTIFEKYGDNQYIAEYNGIRCTAIFNWFVGMYFVDDVYGVIDSAGGE